MIEITLDWINDQCRYWLGALGSPQGFISLVFLAYQDAFLSLYVLLNDGILGVSASQESVSHNVLLDILSRPFGHPYICDRIIVVD